MAATALFAAAAVAGPTPPRPAAPDAGTSYDGATVGAEGSGPVLGPVRAVPASAGPAVPDGREAVAPDGADLARISAETDHGLPVAARRAYVRAAQVVNREHRGCELPWQLVAGIGRVESDHGRYGGSALGVDGVSRPLIRGIALDGNGVAAIRDTDGGRLDGDRVWDRAVGPMQFIPSTWAFAGRDGDRDGRKDPDDLDDAALATAEYLCPASGSILSTPVMRAQVFSYNHDDYYVDLVLAFAVGYRTGVFDIPPPPPEVTESPTDSSTRSDPRARTRPGDRPTSRPTSRPTTSPQPTRTPQPTRDPQPTRPPTPTPTQQPTQQPTTQPTTAAPVVLTKATGAWTACGSTWCLSGKALDLGPSSRYAVEAAADFDGDGTVEANRDELDGLVGSSVTVQVKRGTAVVYLIDGAGYRNADGSFAS